MCERARERERDKERERDGETGNGVIFYKQIISVNILLYLGCREDEKTHTKSYFEMDIAATHCISGAAILIISN